MKCKTCGIALSVFASGDCGRHVNYREPRIVTHSPWVRAALARSLPVSDRTGNIIEVRKNG